MDVQLKFILTQVNDWLKFAEIKNSGLFAVNGAGVIGLLVLLQTMTDYSWLKSVVYYVVIMLVFSLATCLLSFFPRTKLPWLNQKKKPSENDNPIFFAHISYYSPHDYLRLLQAAVNKNDYNATQFDISLAEQIIINSQIAVRKYRFFNIALFFTLSAILTPFIALLLIVIFRKY